MLILERLFLIESCQNATKSTLTKPCLYNTVYTALIELRIYMYVLYTFFKANIKSNIDHNTFTGSNTIHFKLSSIHPKTIFYRY